MKLIFFVLVIISSPAFTQIWNNPIIDTNPNTSNPYTSGQAVSSDITVSGIGRGTGISGTNANNRYNAQGWNSSSFDNTDFFYFTLTPNAGCNVNLLSFVYIGQTSGSGPTSFAFRSSIDGFTANIGTPTSTGATISLSALDFQNISGSITFRLYAWGASAPGGTFSVNNFEFNGTVNCSSNTITTGSVSTSPFNVNCSNGASGSVAFTSDGTFTTGNIYTAQLSDATGSFASPVSIGSITSTANSGSISFTIPPGTPTGTGYRIRIVSTTPSVVGSLSSTFTVTLSGGPCVSTPPHVTSLIFDGCNTGGCNEGESEIVFATTGSYSVNVTSANINLNYTVGTTYNLLGTIVNVPSVTTSINSASGCSGLYVNGFGQTLPPDSRILFLPSNVCTSAFDWTALCGQGPIYVIYGQSGTSGDTWRTGGNFGNSGANRTFELEITSTDNQLHTTDYSYNGTGGNGAYAVYSSTPPGGNPAQQGVFVNCSFNSIVLGGDIIYLEGNYENHQSILNWAVGNERAVSHHNLLRSENGLEWKIISTVSSLGGTNAVNTYQAIDYTPVNGNNYYKVQLIDFDGNVDQERITFVKTQLQNVFYNSQTASIELPKVSDVEIYSIEGKLVAKSFNEKSISFNRSGIYLVRDIKEGITTKIVVN